MKLFSKVLAVTALAALTTTAFADNSKVTATPKATTPVVASQTNKTEKVMINNEDLKNLALLQVKTLVDMLKLTPEQVKIFSQAYADFADGKVQAPDEKTEMALGQKLQAYQAQVAAEEANKRVEADKKAFEKFTANPKVKTDKDGVAYLINELGTGKQVTDKDTVNVTYKGTFTDGKIFDQNTADFPLDRIIPGFRSCVTKLKEGGSVTCYIPYEQGYGERGTGPIPPKAMLVFEVKVNKILPQADKKEDAKK